ncbi:MAG: YggS family pyridoxal phosphate-dependent enzyme [Pseudomonadota bacterium]|nr:YggS family pyridoxal phosphate-dependent enzyme [Pseudomonadota bacterium]
MPSPEMTLERQSSQAIGARLGEVHRRIGAAAKEIGRNAAGVSLIAVSKSQPHSLVRVACEAGHAKFGENRVQEAKTKWVNLREEFPDTVLHLIGPLQTNKCRDAIALFDVIHTVDRGKLAQTLSTEMEKQGLRPEVFIQVNTGEEAQKAGILPSDADGFIKECQTLYDLHVVGLMCIPPQNEHPALHFGLLSDMAERNGLSRLSMGMSADFETAVRLGATEVRVGTAIFGPRG